MIDEHDLRCLHLSINDYDLYFHRFFYKQNELKNKFVDEHRILPTKYTGEKNAQSSEYIAGRLPPKSSIQ
jgi:hypothetical protein